MAHAIEQIGSYAGLAAFLGLGVLALLCFTQARDIRRLREWAGSAPERAGVIAAAKSPPSEVRSAVPKLMYVRTAFAVEVSLNDLNPTSAAKARNASRCASGGMERLRPSGAPLRTAYTETPRTAAKEIAVRIQRFKTVL